MPLFSYLHCLPLFSRLLLKTVQVANDIFSGATLPSVFCCGATLPSVFCSGAALPSVFCSGATLPSVFCSGAALPSVPPLLFF
ncbi:hypothetical protein Y032_0219g2460 [Ancylostoma ceylanicum]|uniref:Uncharacterized protein n=1 Tax=Ancylostoma ceylanicum TaxID=53326 RepID=A0A016SJJ1_9BILA|nr:hypothetical protein Y032_0219g2460 [Ancylostoma ceylanicum]